MQQLVGTVGTGDVLGEMALVDQKVLTFSAGEYFVPHTDLFEHLVERSGKR